MPVEWAKVAVSRVTLLNRFCLRKIYPVSVCLTRVHGLGAYVVFPDVYTYVTRLSSVDSKSIILWGLSFGSVVSACCAAVDRTYIPGTY